MVGNCVEEQTEPWGPSGCGGHSVITNGIMCEIRLLSECQNRGEMLQYLSSAAGQYEDPGPGDWRRPGGGAPV